MSLRLTPFLASIAALALTPVCGLIERAQGAGLTLYQVEGSAEASADFFGTSFPSSSDSALFGPFGGVAIAEVGQTRAVQTGYGFNAVSATGVFGDIPAFALRAETSIDQNVRNDGPSSVDLAFHYTINGGELRLFSPGSFEGLVATVAVSIFVISPGFSGFLWDWGVTLRGSGSGVTSEVHGFSPIFPLNDPLALGIPPISSVSVGGGEAVLSIAPFNADIDLGTLGVGSTALVTYSMYADVSGPGFNATGAKASLGDPFDFTNNPGSEISIPGAALDGVAVPEPGAWMMIGAGLAGLAILPGRKRFGSWR